MTNVKVTPIVGGLPSGGSDSDILIKDSLAPGGYRWSTNPGTPLRIQTGSTVVEVVPSLAALDYPWGTAGQNAVRGRLSGTDFLRAAIRSASAGPSFPGSTGDVIVNFTSGSTQNVHLLAKTFSGRDLTVDGTKLDGIETGAQKNPTTVSVAEKGSAGSVTGLRSFSPKDIVDIANGLSIGNYPQITPTEITQAPTELDLRSFSPADVHSIFDAFNDGEPNPVRVNNNELQDPGSFSSVRSYSPNDIRTTINNLIYTKVSEEYNMIGDNGNYTWSHGEATKPFSVDAIAICQVAEQGFQPGDEIIIGQPISNGFRGIMVTYNPTGSQVIALQANRPYSLKKSNPNDAFYLDPTKWRVQLRGVWVTLSK